MSQIEFMKFLSEIDDHHEGQTTETRLYPNGQGAEVMVQLPQSSWAYVDWLEQTQGGDFAGWVTHCLQTPFEDWPLSKLLMYWLWADECERHRRGMATRSETKPDGYVPYGLAANDR
ncbi:hypothetical protein E2K80_18805 [Rhodophyticola sp. CCM32]|uniref:hypothetical protein n=1 Tax=Rhodophyticola sp. CCM32 TaxID=2916397 RepID=UPI00107F179F|nr:hypothetical protein [Rhodophyticola sp. CCM32]QBY02535.1 hypothetical protein E2K80_18805 [Rhodophyticola sp. CCM32]